MSRESQTRATLAQNIRALIDSDGAKSVREWAMARKLEPRIITGVLARKNAVTLDTLENIALATKLKPWQLLVPNIDPSNLPVVPESDAERRFYASLALAAKALQTARS